MDHRRKRCHKDCRYAYGQFRDAAEALPQNQKNTSGLPRPQTQKTALGFAKKDKKSHRQRADPFCRHYRLQLLPYRLYINTERLMRKQMWCFTK